MASTDIEGAYVLARSTKHPWYRCQSLAKIAEHANGEFLNRVLNESFESAMACHDENRRTSVACWSIRAALSRREVELAKCFLDGCSIQLSMDQDPISRWCAASVLNTIKKHEDLLNSFFEAFCVATREGHGWRVERTIKYLRNDIDVQSDQRYIDYLDRRKAGIENWKMVHKAGKNS